MRGIENEIVSELQTLANDLQAHLHFWYRSRLLLLTELAGLAANSPGFRAPELQKDLDLIQQICPYFLNMYIANAAGVTLAFSPPTNEYGESTIGLSFSDRPYFKELQTTKRPVMSEVFMGRGGVFAPIVTLSAPIIRQGRFAGFTLGALDLSHIQGLLIPYSKNRDMIITIIDSFSQVIASTAPERPPLHLWSLKRKGKVRPMSKNLFRWSPADENLPSMTRWQRSFFVKETPVEDNIPWTLILEAPIAPHQQRLYAIYIKNLSIMAVLVALTLLLALALSRWLSRPLAQLAVVTTNLPDKIMRQSSLAWPESSATEMDSLIVNFQAMTRALEQNFQGLEEHGRALAQTNEALQIEISEREQAEKSLRDSETKYRTLIDHASEGILLVGADGNFLEANRKMEELIGYSKAELLHMNVRQIHPEEDLERTLTSFKELWRRGEGSLLNGWVLRKDGTKVPVDITGTRIEYAGSSLVQGIFKDLTERQKTEAEHLKMSKLESLGTLAGGIAHDFNNILTAILGNINLAILDSTLDERTRERLIMSEKACQRAHALAQRLLTFAKGGAPVKQVAAVGPLLRETATLILAGTRARGEISVPDNIWSVKVDVSQIDQVISNLLINAEQAMPEGGTIKIAAENLEVREKTDQLPLPPGNYVKLAIIDEGTGIPGKYLDKIFDPYFTTKQKGSGLGLAVAYAIIKNNSGYITATSEAGRGTTFLIYLPAIKEGVIAKEGKPAPLCQGQGRVLVMDDEEIVREVLGKMLAHLGYEAELARDGDEAINLYAEAQKSGRPFAAVILDLTIPGGMGGEEVVRELLKIDPQVKALVSSGYSDDQVVADFKKYGFTGLIPKPYRITELSKALGEALKGCN